MSDPRLLSESFPVEGAQGFTLLSLFGPISGVFSFIRTNVADTAMIVSVGIDETEDDPHIHVLVLEGDIQGGKREIPIVNVESRLLGNLHYLHLLQAVGEGVYIFSGSPTLDVLPTTRLFIYELGEILFGGDTLMRSAQTTDTSLFIGRNHETRLMGIVNADTCAFVPSFQSVSTRVATAGPVFLEVPYGSNTVRYVHQRELLGRLMTGSAAHLQFAFEIEGAIAEIAVGINAGHDQHVVLVTYRRNNETFIVPVRVNFGGKRPVFTVDTHRRIKVAGHTGIVKFDGAKFTSVSRDGDGPAIVFAPFSGVDFSLRRMVSAST